MEESTRDLGNPRLSTTLRASSSENGILFSTYMLGVEVIGNVAVVLEGQADVALRIKEKVLNVHCIYVGRA